MVLNTGDVPNLYQPDEKAEILEKMQTAAKDSVSIRIRLAFRYTQYTFLFKVWYKHSLIFVFPLCSVFYKFYQIQIFQLSTTTIKGQIS